MRIAVISDTHGIFDDRFRDFFADCDEIWHAGDFGGGFDTAAQIASFRKLVGVAGNCDDRRMLFDYPVYQYFVREGKGILMTHIGGYPGHYDRYALQLIDRFRPDIFVCGHSHILRVMPDKERKMLVINPGAAGLQGFHIVRTAIRLVLTDEGVSELEVLNIER